MEAVYWVWDVLLAAGSLAALTFVVLMALALNALTIFYLGSAVVVLDRFARIARRWPWVLFFGGLAVVTTSIILMRAASPELAAATARDWLRMFMTTTLLTALAMGGLWLALRWLSADRLGRSALVFLGVAGGLFVGATADVRYALAPFGTAAVVAGVLALMRRRRSRKLPNGALPASETERDLRWLTGALAIGIPIALALPEPLRALATASAGAFQLFFGFVVLGLLPLAAAGLVEARRTAEWFIALRYMFSRRRQVFLSAITLICITGIAAGVWLIITVLSVMNGFERTWREEIIGSRAHFTVHSLHGPIEDYEVVLAAVAADPDVTGVSPFVDVGGMVRGRNGTIANVRLRGVDPETVGNVTSLREDIVQGSLDGLRAAPSNAPSNGSSSSQSDPGIVIGTALAEKVGAGVGDELLLISPYGGAKTPLGASPRLTRFRVVGVFETKFYQYDTLYTYVNLAAAQAFGAIDDRVDGVEARTRDLYTSGQVASSVAAKLEYPYFTRDWKDYFPAIFEMLRDNRSMMLFLLSAIMVMAAFLIVATLLLMIMEKSADISILKVQGTSDEAIERIFAIEGALIGLAGVLIGVAAGIAVTERLPWIQQTIEAITGIDTLPASIYQISTLPSQVDPVQLVVIAAMAMVLSLGATLVPSRQGARVDPAEGLRDR